MEELLLGVGIGGGAVALLSLLLFRLEPRWSRRRAPRIVEAPLPEYDPAIDEVATTAAARLREYRRRNALEGALPPVAEGGVLEDSPPVVDDSAPGEELSGAERYQRMKRGQQ